MPEHQAQPDRRFAHKAQYRIMLASDADARAPGGAITVALCGHWDHDGPCRWPHFTGIEETNDVGHVVTVHFDAPADEYDDVQALIDGAMMRGSQVGPDGLLSQWTLSPTQT